MRVPRLASLLLAAAIVACTGVKGTVVTEANKEQVVAKVAKSDLTQEEKELFTSYVTSYAMMKSLAAQGGVIGAAASAQPMSLDGMTVEQVIAHVRDLRQKEAQAKAEEAKREAEAKRIAQEYMPKLELSKVAVDRKDYGTFGMATRVQGVLKNLGDRTVSDVLMAVYYLDKNGKRIGEDTFRPVLSDEPLKANYSKTFSTYMSKADSPYPNDPPAGWSGKAEVKVAEVGFADEKPAGQ